MATNGNSCIFRLTNNGDTESNVTDKIEFDDAVITPANAHVYETQIGINCAVAENEKPKGNMNELQDLFLDGVPFQITGSVEIPQNTVISSRTKQWGIEPKTNTTFTKGRIGIRMNDFPGFNVVPQTLSSGKARGLMFIDWQWTRQGNYPGKANFIAHFRLNGDTGTAPNYDWTV